MKIQPLLDKLAQASTWRGIIALSAVFGVIVQPDMTDAIVTAGISIIAIINIAKKG